jgi:hypothetical protein
MIEGGWRRAARGSLEREPRSGTVFLRAMGIRRNWVNSISSLQLSRGKGIREVRALRTGHEGSTTLPERERREYLRAGEKGGTGEPPSKAQSIPARGRQLQVERRSAIPETKGAERQSGGAVSRSYIRKATHRNCPKDSGGHQARPQGDPSPAQNSRSQACRARPRRCTAHQA